VPAFTHFSSGGHDSLCPPYILIEM
jgi:hypothetical protein